MRAVVIALLAALPAIPLSADFSYQETIKVTGGALYNTLHSTSKTAGEPMVSTKMIKGNRLAEVTKERTTVIDLDKETITQMDLLKKTYSVITFAQMKEEMHTGEAMFKVSTKTTGQTKSAGVLTARETISTMTIDAAGIDPTDTDPTKNDASGSGGITVVLDAWMVIVPGYDEVQRFARKLSEKMGSAFASGMAPLAMGRAEALQGFAETTKELIKANGAPVHRTVKVVTGNDASTPDAFVPAAFPPDPHQNPASAAASAALGRLKFGHKKDQPAVSASTSLIETLTELTEFSSAPVDASKFEAPSGFKQITGKELQGHGASSADKN